MQLRIDVLDASNNKLGSGPITSATQWKNIPRLDKGGDFSFRMPASDPRAALIQPKRVVQCYAMVDGAMTLQGSGIVDQIHLSGDGANPTYLDVSGSDLSRELSYRTCGTFTIGQSGWVSPDDLHSLHISKTTGGMIDGSGAPTTDPTAAGYTSYANAMDGNSGTSAVMGPFDSFHRWYIGFSLPYNEVNFTFATACTTAGATWDSIQYYSNKLGGVIGASGWQNLTGVVDHTISGGIVWGTNGFLIFTPPVDWQALDQSVWNGTQYVTVTGYWLRFQGDDVSPPSATVSEIQVWSTVPTATGPNEALAFAPAGWALDGAGHSLTAMAIQAASQDETVLAALTKIGTLTYEHFRFGAARTVYWLQRDAPASGVRAMRVTDGLRMESNATVAAITKLSKVTDSTSLCTRIIPYGAGQNTGRLTLANTTRATDGVNPLPSGYTLDTTNNQIVNTTAETTYGRIETVQTWSNVGPPTTAKADLIPAANALFDVALFYLEQHCAPIDTYALSVTGLQMALLPGQTVRVVWKEIVDGYTALDVNADLIVLEATNQIDQMGIRTVDLLVSSVPIWPKTEAEVLAAALAMIQQMHAHPQRHSLGNLYVPAGAYGGAVVYATSAGGVYQHT